LDLIRIEAAAASTRIRFVDALPMSESIAEQTRSWRLGASMFTAFGFLALLVATWGLVSVLAFDVALRRQELAIRSALGAHAARLVRLVLRRVLALVGAGVAVGLLAARAASGFLEPLLFRVSPTDAVTYVVVSVSLLLVAVVAGSVPAWRGARVDPREALQAN
jgi:ABC-type antimicrobial peptide transport system permease subunit